MCSSAQETGFRVAFYNVENFFDNQDDSLTADDEYTAQGQRHWTRRRMETKRNNILKTIAAMDYPAVMGLAEVENAYVLRELLKGTPLRKRDYGFVHFDSPDARGVDCALIYRKPLLKPIETKAIGFSDSTFRTRDILLVEGVTEHGDTLFLFVNHWPSKLGGDQADLHRLRIASRLRSIMDSLHRQHPTALVVAMGDFNSTPEEDAVAKGMGFDGADTNAEGLRNLMATLPPEQGSYYYQGHWSYIDQFFVTGPVARVAQLRAEVYRGDFLMTDDPKYLCQRTFRTYLGMRYQGGYSDHLPIYFDLK